MSTTTYVCELDPLQGDVYAIQPDMLLFVSDLQNVFGFFLELRFPPPIKLTAIVFKK